MATLNFNATNVEPASTPKPIPAGWYNAIITESEIKPTQAGTGSLLALQFKVLDGEYANRVVFTNLNIDNPNPVAVEIAYGHLSAICHAVNEVQLQDSQQLHGKPLQIKVAVTPGTQQYPDDRNEIKGFQPVQATGAVTANNAASTATSAPQQQAAPDWAQQHVAPAAKEPVAEASVQQETAQQQAAPQAEASGKPPWAQ